MKAVPMNLSWLCIVIPIITIVVVAILGTLSKLRYASRIRDAQARDAFADLNAPENKSRFRRLAATALIGSLGMIVSIAVLVLLEMKHTGYYFGIPLIVLAILFGILASIAGFLMQREIDRRL